MLHVPDVAACCDRDLIEAGLSEPAFARCYGDFILAACFGRDEYNGSKRLEAVHRLFETRRILSDSCICVVPSG